MNIQRTDTYSTDQPAGATTTMTLPGDRHPLEETIRQMAALILPALQHWERIGWPEDLPHIEELREVLRLAMREP